MKRVGGFKRPINILYLCGLTPFFNFHTTGSRQLQNCHIYRDFNFLAQCRVSLGYFTFTDWSKMQELSHFFRVGFTAYYIFMQYFINCFLYVP